MAYAKRLGYHRSGPGRFLLCGLDANAFDTVFQIVGGFRKRFQCGFIRLDRKSVV